MPNDWKKVPATYSDAYWDPQRSKIRNRWCNPVRITYCIRYIDNTNTLQCRADLHGADTAGRCILEKQWSTPSLSKRAGNLKQGQSVSVEERQSCEQTETPFSFGLQLPECSFNDLLNIAKLARTQAWIQGKQESGHKIFFSFLGNYVWVKNESI